MLADLLSELRTEGTSLDLVGFDDLDLDRMLEHGAVDPVAEWRGMPAFDQPDKMPVRQLIVNFQSEEDAQRFGEFIGQPLTEDTRSIWYPEVEQEHPITKHYGVK